MNELMFILVHRGADGLYRESCGAEILRSVANRAVESHM